MIRNVYIDGENFVHIIVASLRKQGIINSRSELKNFDLLHIINFVTKIRPAKNQKITYYGAKLQVYKNNEILEATSREMVKWNANWVSLLQRQKINFIKCGHLRLRDSHRCSHCGNIDQLFLEKGVDVGMAVDIVSDALKGKVDEIVLFSADSDMLPAIKRAHSAGVKIIYAAYSEAVNRALTTMVDEVWVFSAKQVAESYKRVNK
jgi:uncharacterized LabA/DUF88 family protein